MSRLTSFLGLLISMVMIGMGNLKGLNLLAVFSLDDALAVAVCTKLHNLRMGQLAGYKKWAQDQIFTNFYFRIQLNKLLPLCITLNKSTDLHDLLLQHTP